MTYNVFGGMYVKPCSINQGGSGRRVLVLPPLVSYFCHWVQQSTLSYFVGGKFDNWQFTGLRAFDKYC